MRLGSSTGLHLSAVSRSTLSTSLVQILMNSKCTASAFFPPVSINDEFCDGRYRVMHKLGFGSYSNIWLARDLTAQRWVAFKVQTADASALGVENSNLKYISRHRLF